MKYMMLPHVHGGFEEWMIRPKWILSGSRLHAICWIEPNESEADRFFVYHPKGKPAVVGRFIASNKDDDDQRAIVACGREDAVGLLTIPEECDVPFCGHCSTTIRSILSGERVSLWSSQLAQSRIDSIQEGYKQAGNLIAQWAMSQFNPDDPKLCVKIAKDISSRSPNAGTNFLDEVVGSGLGMPSVDIDVTPNVLKWINESFDDMQMGFKQGSAKRAKTLELRRSSIRTSYVEPLPNKQQVLFDPFGDGVEVAP